MTKCTSCAACCSVYCFICSILLGTFVGLVEGSISFDIIAARHHWKDISLKVRACYLAAGYYFAFSIILFIIGFVIPWCKQRKSDGAADLNKSKEARMMQYRSGGASRSPPPPAPGSANIQRTFNAELDVAELSSLSDNLSPNSSSTRQLINGNPSSQEQQQRSSSNVEK